MTDSGYYEERKYRITVVNDLLAMAPGEEDIYDVFMRDKLDKHNAAGRTTAESENIDFEEEKEMAVEVDSPTDMRGKTVFHKDPDGIYLINYQFKGFLKKAGLVMKDILNVKQLRYKIADYLFVYPRFIWLKEEPDGVKQRPLPGMTAKGPRTSLASSEIVSAGTVFEVKLRLYKHKELSWTIVEALLDYGQDQGIGCWRGAQWGTFTWQRVE